uniref:C-type lectin domain-containing protein n=1 Tax=Amphilophus citrinellus TaxID=61819 RepID=A0A3Q0T6E7_AMPCI
LSFEIHCKLTSCPVSKLYPMYESKLTNSHIHGNIPDRPFYHIQKVSDSFRCLRLPNTEPFRGGGGNLTSLRNDAEYQMVQEAVSGFEVWIGPFRDSWEWSDQTDSSFRYWKASQRVPFNISNCSGLVKTASGRWGELSCEDTYPFLCDSSECKLFHVHIREISSE